MNPKDYDPLAAYSGPTLTDKVRAFVTSKSVRTHLFPTLLLIVATILLYGHSLWNPLVFDDANILNEAALKQYATSFELGQRWLSYRSFGLTYSLFGTDWFWYRLGNLGLHALTAVLLFTFFYRLLVAVLPQQDSALPHRWLAFFGALAFAWHPVSVYGVAYLVERSIVMATLFGIAALLCYLEGLTREKAGWFAGSAFFYFLAVSSKDHSIMLPGIAIALSFLLQKFTFSHVRKYWLPLAVLLGIGLFIIVRSKNLLGTVYEPTAFEIFSQMRKHEMGPNLDNAYPLSIITQGHLFFQYLLLWIVPYTGWMSIDIRQPFAAHLFTWPQTVGFIAFLAYPIITTRFLIKGGRQGLLGLGMLFPWILFLTELSVVRVAEPFVLYRSYLWMSGLPLALLALLSIVPRKMAAPLLAIICLALVPMAWNRLDTFSNEIKLWSDVIQNNLGKINQGVERGYNYRGIAYREAGHYQNAISDFKTAHTLNTSNPGYSNIGDIGIVYFQFNHLVEGARDAEALHKITEEIKLKPDSSEAYLKRGVLLLKWFRPVNALNDFNFAVQLNPKNAEAYSNRGFAYSRLNNFNEAMNNLDKAIELNPKLAQAYMNRGIVSILMGRSQAALDDLDRAIQLDPKNAEIHFNRGNINVTLKRYQNALQDYGNAIVCDPKLADAYANRGSIYMLTNQLPEAEAEFGKALAINPDHENAYLNRAKINLALSRHQEAMSDSEKVLNLNHRNSEALLYRGILLLDQQRRKEAKVSFQRSCEAGNPAGCERLKEMGR
ncbi:MAG: tetratricopeptide repeat protein [Betaproteobacteria bacterium]|nr:tetratricopeptide repeat protein [Betaproteobacteria bacterium]